jgi:DNA-binding HxlR family transcriptional regulator
MEMSEENIQQRQFLRSLKSFQRIQIAFELHDLARSRVAGEIKRRYPNLTQEELQEKLNQRFIR